MATAIADLGGGRLLTFLYDPEWVIMFDNPVQAWIIDETGTAPAKPVIIGELPPEAGDTGDIRSPQWAQFVGNAIYIPDELRTTVAGLFTFLATNNGARRKLWPEFMDPTLMGFFRQWAEGNPDLALEHDPTEPPPDQTVSAVSRAMYGEPHRQVIPDGARVPPPRVSPRPEAEGIEGRDRPTTSRPGDDPRTVQDTRDAMAAQTLAATGMAAPPAHEARTDARPADARPADARPADPRSSDTKAEHRPAETKAPAPAPAPATKK